MAQKPLMLKDYLELESCSESFWWAPLQRAGGNTIRSLLETEFAEKTGWRLVRSRSKGALTRLSAVIKLLQFSADEASGSFSRKLRRSFWKRRGYEKEVEGKIMVKDIVRLRSFDEGTVERGSLSCPSPAVGRCSSSFDLFVEEKESMPISPRTEKGIFVAAGDESRRPFAGSGETEEICGKADMDCPSEEEKEQFSPVSVMDFPYQDEEEDEAVVEQPSTTAPCFEQSVINIERTKNQLLQQIRRFESLANLDPVDLDHRFASTETTVHVETDDEEAGYENEARGRRRTASALLRRFTGNNSLPACGEKLLFDFFVEGLSFAGDDELLRSASGWVAGGGCAAEHDGDVVVREMERGGGGWKRFDKEEEIVAVEMTGVMVTWLVEELVDDLLVSVV